MIRPAHSLIAASLVLLAAALPAQAQEGGCEDLATQVEARLTQADTAISAENRAKATRLHRVGAKMCAVGERASARRALNQAATLLTVETAATPAPTAP